MCSCRFGADLILPSSLNHRLRQRLIANTPEPLPQVITPQREHELALAVVLQENHAHVAEVSGKAISTRLLWYLSLAVGSLSVC